MVDSTARPPLPPFTLETATAKVKAAEAAWNSRDPERVALAYTEDSEWRNRAEFITGRAAIVAFLKRKWAKELDYRLRTELWCFADHRIAGDRAQSLGDLACAVPFGPEFLEFRDAFFGPAHELSLHSLRESCKTQHMGCACAPDFPNT